MYPAVIRLFKDNCKRFVGLLLVWFTVLPIAYPDIRQGGADLGPNPLTKEKASDFLCVFRRSRIETDYCAQFYLTHLPVKGPEIVYHGTIWGTWIENGPCVRVRIEANPNVVGSQVIEMILVSGSNLSSCIRRGQSAVETISQEQLYAPLAPPLTYRPFDLQMPFLYWPTYLYEGAKKLKGRPTEMYAMKNTSGVGPYSGVKVYIDSGFKCLLRAEYLDFQNQKISTLEILDFKKYGSQWMIQSIDLVDHVSKDKTRLTVSSFTPATYKDKWLFSPESLNSVP